MSIKTVTAVGDAQIDTAQFKFGAASGLFDGTGDALTVPDNDDWTFGDFTVELWFRRATTSDGGLFGQMTGNPGPRYTMYQEAGVLKLYYHDGTATRIAIAGATAIANTTWYSAAFVRSGDDFTIYLDGTREATANYAAGTLNFTGVFTIGDDATSGFYFNGHIDEIRVT